MNDTKNFCTRFSLDTFPWNPPTPWKMETSGRCDFESNWKCIQMVLVQVTGIRFLSNGRGKFPGRRCKFKRCIASGYGSLYRERREGESSFQFFKDIKSNGHEKRFPTSFSAKKRRRVGHHWMAKTLNVPAKCSQVDYSEYNKETFGDALDGAAYALLSSFRVIADNFS